MSRASRLLLPWICVCSASACADDDPESTPLPEAIVATVSPTMPTVVHVTWTTARPATGVVRYGTGGALTHATPASVTPSTEHRHTLLGLRADTDYTFQVVVDEDATSEPQIVRTGPLPTGTPQFVVEGTGHDGFVVVPMIGAATRVVILDAEGHIVWSREVTNEHDVYRARLSVDGASILYNAATVSGDPTADTRLVRVALDGSAETSIPMPLLAHDFVEHPDGTIGAIVVEYRDVDGVSVRGDQIVEVEPTGEVTPVWSAWDCFDPADETGDDIEHGWTFANAIDYDPVERVYYLGMRNFSSIAKIRPDTRACEWVLGATARTIAFASGAERFLHQHQFHVLGNRLLVFDNEGAIENASRLLEYEIDFATMEARTVWSYVATPPVFSFVLGEPTRLPDGDTFVTWSAAGQMERIGPAGDRKWKLNAPAGNVFGFHTLAPSLYPAGT